MSPQERREHVDQGFRVEDLTPARLQAIADGEIMDPNGIYLPKGRLTEAEYRAREARILAGEAP